MSTPAALSLPGISNSQAPRSRAARRLAAGQRKTRRTSLVLELEDEVLLDALQERFGPEASIGETLRRGLRHLAAEEGIDTNQLLAKLEEEQTAAA